MAENNPPTLLSLPTELVHYIFDYLDIRTILLSLRSVCTQLRAASSVYNRYAINLRSITKPDFYHLCSIIRPENVVSLVLSDDEESVGEIDLFLSIFNIHQFIRLRSFALRLTDDDHLDTILSHAMNCSLTSLSIERPRTPTHRKTTLDLLSSIMRKNTLRQFRCTIDLLSTDRFHWPLQCSIEHLTLDYCTRRQFCVVLDHLPHLRTMIMCNCFLNLGDQSGDCSRQYHQLTSLTMKRLFLSMDEVESLLDLIPSLVHLRLQGSADVTIFDSYRWEKLIRTKVSCLENFEFYFRFQNTRLVELSTVEFRTSFWLAEKYWPVYFVYDTSMEELYVCSTPDFVEELEYQFVGPVVISNTITNTANTMHDNEPFTLAFFQRIIELEVSEDVLDSWKYISSLVDLSQVKKLKILLFDGQDFDSRIKEKMVKLFKETNNLRSLEILFEGGLTTDSLCLESICSILPDHVKHLNIEAETLKDVNLILHRLLHLSSATFRRLPSTYLSTENLADWYAQVKRSLTYRHDQHSLHVWLDKPIRLDRTTNCSFFTQP